jgi:hypothetical protein
MLQALIDGEQDPARLAEMAKGLLRNKIPELKLALQGRMTKHHRFLLRQLLDHLRFTESKLGEIEQEIERRMDPFEDKVIRLCTIPGVDRVTAWGMLAEMGMNMNQFPSSEHLSSWACLCPGSFESAGKRLSGKMRKGNVSLRRCLSQAAWAISMTKNNLQRVFQKDCGTLEDCDSPRGMLKAVTERSPVALKGEHWHFSEGVGGLIPKAGGSLQKGPGCPGTDRAPQLMRLPRFACRESLLATIPVVPNRQFYGLPFTPATRLLAGLKPPDSLHRC